MTPLNDRCTSCNHLRKHHHDGRCDATGPIFRDYCYCKEFMENMVRAPSPEELEKATEYWRTKEAPDA